MSRATREGRPPTRGSQRVAGEMTLRPSPEPVRGGPGEFPCRNGQPEGRLVSRAGGALQIMVSTLP